MFDEVTKREGGKRAARRSFWILGSTALQTGVVAAVVLVSAALAKTVSEGPLVPVKIVKAAVAPAPPKPPPPPPAPPKKAATQKPKVTPKPQMAMIQPKEVPPDLKPPDPNPPEEDYGSDDGVEGGVIGGVVGGVVGGSAAPPPPQPSAPAAPVKFNNTMTPPVLVGGPPLEYTAQALEREIEGTMVVECVVQVDGGVRDCHVLRGLPFMDRAVVANLEQRRYRAATLGGRPLDVQYTFTIRLKLPQ